MITKILTYSKYKIYFDEQGSILAKHDSYKIFLQFQHWCGLWSCWSPYSKVGGKSELFIFNYNYLLYICYIFIAYVLYICSKCVIYLLHFDWCSPNCKMVKGIVDTGMTKEISSSLSSTSSPFLPWRWFSFFLGNNFLSSLEVIFFIFSWRWFSFHLSSKLDQLGPSWKGSKKFNMTRYSSLQMLLLLNSKVEWVLCAWNYYHYDLMI